MEVLPSDAASIASVAIAFSISGLVLISLAALYLVAKSGPDFATGEAWTTSYLHAD